MPFEISPQLIENEHISIDTDGNGNIILVEKKSGNDKELGRYDQSSGKWELGTTDPLGAISTDDLDIGTQDVYQTGDFIRFATYTANSNGFSTTSTSYVSDDDYMRIKMIWDSFPSSADAVQFWGDLDGRNEPADLRLRNNVDSENVFEITDATSLLNLNRIDSYIPPTTGGHIDLIPELRTDDGSDSISLYRGQFAVGVET